NPCGDYAITQTKVFGEPAPEAESKLAFFDLTDGVQLELIEPNKKPSVWRDHLDKYGEGIHHIAFVVDSIDETVAKCLEMGMVLEQEGFYGDASGKYAYIDAQDMLKCRIELLENFKK
ncbi:MAG TPA: VOC family protein, partial [Lachnospiraceae bacterium]|nr:VOC family protein [Lachnospiraceae bacterium]